MELKKKTRKKEDWGLGIISLHPFTIKKRGNFGSWMGTATF